MIKLLRDENVPHLEINEVALVHYNIVYSNYQQDLRDFYIFLPNKSFSQLLAVSPKYFIFFKILNSELSHIEIWFTDQSFVAL